MLYHSSLWGQSIPRQSSVFRLQLSWALLKQVKFKLFCGFIYEWWIVRRLNLGPLPRNSNGHERVTKKKVSNASSSFELDVVLCSVSVTQKLLSLQVFRQAGPPQRVDCSAPMSETALKGH